MEDDKNDFADLRADRRQVSAGVTDDAGMALNEDHSFTGPIKLLHVLTLSDEGDIGLIFP